MPVRPIIDKTILLRLLDELADYGLSEEDVDFTLVRDGPVDLDLLAECKHEHPYFNGSQTGARRAYDAQKRGAIRPRWLR